MCDSLEEGAAFEPIVYEVAEGVAEGVEEFTPVQNSYEQLDYLENDVFADEFLD